MLCLVLLAALIHPNSISSAELERSAVDRMHVELRFEARTVNELIPLDLDGDGRLSEGELESGRGELARHLEGNYQLSSGSEQPSDSTPLVPSLESLTLDPASTNEELGTTWLVAELSYTGPLEDTLWVRCSLFQETSPDHRNFARFNGPPTVDWVFSAADPLWLIDLPEVAASATQPRLVPWLRLGFEHILEGPDHLCFVLGLLLAAGGLRQLAFSITGFTLAHSITLGLAATGAIPVGGRWSEVLIAASIVYVGAANLGRGTPRRAWPEAFGFGLVHGLGFAAALAEALSALGPGAPKLLPLFGFNLGIELGQLAAALAALALLAVLRRVTGRGGLIERIASAAVLTTGLGWLLLRLFA